MPKFRDAALAAAFFIAGAGVASAQVVPAAVAAAQPPAPVPTIVAFLPTGHGPVYPAPTPRKVYYNEPIANYGVTPACGPNCVRAGY